jgi:hypothetical protein
MATDANDTTPCLSLYGRVTELILALAAEFSEHNHAITKLDIKRMEQHLARENNLCADVRWTVGELRNARLACPWPEGEVFREMRRKLDTARLELINIAGIHAALTRRVCRSAQAILNIAASLQGGYPDVIAGRRNSGLYRGA